MAKRTGLGQKFYAVQIGSGPAYDLSNDICSIDTADSSFATIDVTGIDKSAHERLAGLADSKLQVTTFWNNAAGGEHAIDKALDGLAVRAFWIGSGNEGDGLAFVISGIMTNRPATRAANGSLMAKPQIDGYSGDMADWGIPVAFGVDASAANHTGYDFGQYGAPSTISANSVANPTVVTTSTPHGLTTGDSVNITSSNSTPAINGDYVATVTDSTHFTVPVNVTGSGSAGTVVKTSSRLGGVLTACITAIGSGTNAAVKVQHSADNGVADAWADIGITTSALTAAAAESRVRVSNVLVKRWVRAVTTGTFTNLSLLAVFKRYQGAE